MSSVQNDAQSTPVHLVYQFTKLAGQPLTKARGFPAPYLAQSTRVPADFRNGRPRHGLCR